MADTKTVQPGKTFATLSGLPLKPAYGPEDVLQAAAAPGDFPYTRAIHPQMYRQKRWTMRQFSGFATPEQTNERYRYLLAQGQTGLSIAFDLPTLMGYDADQPEAQGEVGKCGVAISSLEDMQTLFRGIPLGKVSVSMTINSPAALIWAMYLAVARRAGRGRRRAFRHVAKRHPEGIHRAKGVHLSAPPVDAVGDGCG